MTWHEDLADALEVVRDTFGEPVLYWFDEDLPPLEIEGVFDQPSLRDDMDYPGMEAYETNVSGSAPRLFVKLEDLNQKPSQGDELQVRQTRYQVIDTDFDGHGGADLILRRI